jgi:putative membrane protein
MMGYGWGMGPWGWIFMGLLWVVVIGAIVWAAAALLPGNRRGGHSGARESAREILDRRFASGEIDADQYRKAREELSASDQKR